jgi:phage replication O-like protein O
MASPQREHGYTAIANEIMEALARFRIPGEQHQCLDHILRMTYGWNRKEAKISLSDFAKATNIQRTHVYRALKNLQEKKLINVTKKGNRETITYEFNKNYEEWVALPKKITGKGREPILKRHCYVCNFKDALEKHHITPVSEGGSNRIENKINLCPNCHTLIHKGKYTKKDLLSLKINTETVTKKGDKTVTKKGNEGKPPPIIVKTIKKSENFDLFWKNYPIKKGKKKAREIWDRLKKKNELPGIDKIISAIGEQTSEREYLQSNGKFCAEWKNPTTWLNQGCWDDEVKIPNESLPGYIYTANE